LAAPRPFRQVVAVRLREREPGRAPTEFLRHLKETCDAAAFKLLNSESK